MPTATPLLPVSLSQLPHPHPFHLTMQNPLPHSQLYSSWCLFCSQPGHSIQKCWQATIWLHAPFRLRIRRLKDDLPLPENVHATPLPAEDTTTPSTPAPSPLLEVPADPIPASSPSPAASSPPAQHPLTAPPSSKAIMLTPQPSSTALTTSLPASLDSQSSAVTTAALPAQATTLPADNAPRMAPPSPLAAPLPHPSDVMRKAKPRHA
jgi:hypothetical protein